MHKRVDFTYGPNPNFRVKRFFKAKLSIDRHVELMPSCGLFRPLKSKPKAKETMTVIYFQLAMRWAYAGKASLAG